MNTHTHDRDTQPCTCDLTKAQNCPRHMDMMIEGQTIQNYVAGFLFDKFQRNVLLIEKLKPEWQAGRLNGIGGKIEHDETPYKAMVREFKEEAGLAIPDWRQFARLRGRTYVVYFFTATYPWDLTEAKAMTKEQLIVVPVNKIYDVRAIDNLKWLVPMAASLDPYTAEVHDEF